MRSFWNLPFTYSKSYPTIQNLFQTKIPSIIRGHFSKLKLYLLNLVVGLLIKRPHTCKVQTPENSLDFFSNDAEFAILDVKFMFYREEDCCIQILLTNLKNDSKNVFSRAEITINTIYQIYNPTKSSATSVSLQDEEMNNFQQREFTYTTTEA